jgi:predicted transcriptional regulator
MQGAEGAEIIKFLKSVSTVTRCMEFATEEQLGSLPPHIAKHIEELEDLLSRLSLEAEALLWRAGRGHELYAKKGRGE